MNLRAELLGSQELQLRFSQTLPAALVKSVGDGVGRALLRLQAYVLRQKLTAPPGFSPDQLHVRTGRLRRSITTKMLAPLAGAVGTNVEYARIHEFGGQFKTRLGTGKRKPRAGAKAMAVMPERSFLRSSLREQVSEIREDILTGLRQGLKS